MGHDDTGRDDEGGEDEERLELEAEIVEDAPAEGHELAPSSPEDIRSMRPIAVLERYQMARLRSRKELEAMEIVLDSRLAELRHAADSRSAESKARWDARTAEVVSGLKTVVQAQLRGIENERMGGRFESIEKAYRTFAAKVRDVETGELPEELRQDLVAKLRQNLEATIKRLEDDTIADRYDLKD